MNYRARRICRKKKSPNQKREIFVYVLFMLWPTLQFIIFYIGVNFNSLIMAFQSYDRSTGFSFDAEFHAFSQMAYFFTNEGGFKMVGISMLSYLITLLINVPLGLFFSYYISKKMTGSKFFRVILFTPSILSAIVTGIIYRSFVSYALPELIPSFTDPFSDNAANWVTYIAVMIYNILISFGTSVLMYSNRMSGISTEMIEASRLDGAKGFKEFWHITLPQVFPTLSVFLITGFGSMFANQIGLYSLFSSNLNGQKVSDIQTIGFYLFNQGSKYETNIAFFPKLVAIGLVITAIMIPTTLLLRWALNKYGPSEN